MLLDLIFHYLNLNKSLIRFKVIIFYLLILFLNFRFLYYFLLIIELIFKCINYYLLHITKVILNFKSNFIYAC